MSPAVNEIMSSGGGSGWGSTWDDFNKLHQRLLTDFHRDFFTSSFDNIGGGSASANSDSVQIKNEKDKFIVSVDLSDFKPEELKVSTFDNVLKIEGKHIEESGNGTGNDSCSKYVSRQFSRSYTLPADCKVNEMTSSFGSGKLTVNVPKSRPAIEEIPSRSVPISVRHETSAASSALKQTGGETATTSVGEPSVRQVKINHHVKQEKRGAQEKAESMASSRTSSPTTSSASKSPEPPMTSSFDMDRGSSLFHRWVRPIQLFDEDFFVDSFWNDRSGSSSGGGAEDLDGWMQPSVIRSSVGSKVQVNDNDQRFEFIIPTDDYAPQELKVTVLDDVLKIEGKHIDEQSEGEGDLQKKRKTVSKQFSRSYVLPKHVYKMDQVESCLTKAKNLVVKVPKIQPKTNAFNVPIKML